MATPKSRIIIAIDGPAGSGKSTTAKMLARRLRLPYIDTGAMYRALTFLALQKGIGWSEGKRLAVLARAARIDLKGKSGGRYEVWANGQNVTSEIRTPELTNLVHHVASNPAIRAAMVRLQRRFGEKRGGVLEGRDIGTVVFPRAPYKFYLDADFDLRVRRRWRELRAKGTRVSVAAVRRDLKARDKKDLTRRVGGLRQAPDAIRVDTTGLTIPETVAIITRIVKHPHGRIP